MFGYVRPYLADLSEEEKKRYRGVYCGLCRALNEKYGLAGRMGLNYDMTFLILLLSSLYEPREQSRETVCPPHPLKKHREITNEFTQYAADMTVALTYYKALDDWQDEKKAMGKMYADLLKKHYFAVRKRYPRQCQAIEESIAAIHQVEKDPGIPPEQAADWSGKMLGSLFALREDYFRPQLAWLGYSLGKFIYVLDAAVDYETDQKKGCFNPLPGMQLTPASASDVLRQPLGQAAEIFEGLPLVQDVGILRNILYEGVWQVYNAKTAAKEGENGGQ